MADFSSRWEGSNVPKSSEKERLKCPAVAPAPHTEPIGNANELSGYVVLFACSGLRDPSASNGLIVIGYCVGIDGRRGHGRPELFAALHESGCRFPSLRSPVPSPVLGCPA